MLPSFLSNEFVIHSKKSVAPVPLIVTSIFPPLETVDGLPVGHRILSPMNIGSKYRTMAYFGAFSLI